MALLRDAIQSGRFAPGQRLIEADLMKSVQATRGPLREALRRLASEGLVEIVPNRGAMVRSLSRREMHDLFRIREVVEGLAARLAAEAMRDATRRAEYQARLAEIEIMGQAPGASFSDENIAFHELILRFADNPQLTGLMRQLQLPLARFQIRASVDDGYRLASRAEHGLLGVAIRSGDAEAAERLMRAHLRQACERVMERLA